MVGETDQKDRTEARRVAIALIVLLLVLGAAVALMIPLLGEFVATYLTPGIGLRDAAVIAFFVSVLLMVVFAVAAGDGLLGELQFMLGGFLGFFLICWLMIAWIF